MLLRRIAHWLRPEAKSSQPVVFWVSLCLALGFVGFGASFPKLASDIGAALLGFVTHEVRHALQRGNALVFYSTALPNL